MDLFDREAQKSAPLADRMRPRRLSEMVGQAHVLGKGRVLERAVQARRLPSMILAGPPGSGKTSLARALADVVKARFVPFSAVLGGVPELRKILAAAAERRQRGEATLLFIDEIHRFNKAQQDALLPHVENGTVTLLGATTENPSFAVNAALLSRARVFRLEPLSVEDVATLVRRAVTDDERGLGKLGLAIDPDAVDALAAGSRGDARRALDVLEVAATHVAADDERTERRITIEDVAEALGGQTLLYDKSGEEHYNVISAFIKSMRGTDPDAAIYWMMRMLDAGEDPLFVARRMIIFASEDIGNADPRALELAVAADRAFARLGMPEGIFPLAQCCTYLAAAPKSNASYQAFEAARKDIADKGALPVPPHLRNAPTKLMKEWGYGQGYRYPHDEGGFSRGATYLPGELTGRRYYVPKGSGYESRIAERLARLRGEEEP